MGYIYKNITGSDATLLEKVNYKTVYNNMTLCNTHLTDSVDISIYFRDITVEPGPSYNVDSDENSVKTPVLYYMIRNVNIPVGATLVLDKTYFLNLKYKMYVQLSAAGSTVSVILN